MSCRVMSSHVVLCLAVPCCNLSCCVVLFFVISVRSYPTRRHKSIFFTSRDFQVLKNRYLENSAVRFGSPRFLGLNSFFRPYGI